MTGKFEQCSEECGRKNLHTRVWGLCKKGVRPAPYLLVPREANVDGEISVEWVQVPASNFLPWITDLPLGGQIDCLSEIASVADEDREGVVAGWRSTAYIHSVPELHEALSRPFDINDYQEAPRPEAPEEYEGNIDHDLRRRIQTLARFIANHDSAQCDKPHASRHEEENCDFRTRARYRKMRELIDLYFGEAYSAAQERADARAIDAAQGQPVPLEQVVADLGLSGGVPVTEEYIEAASKEAEAGFDESRLTEREQEQVEQVDSNLGAGQPISMAEHVTHSPFTAQQVLAINTYQLSGTMHPFTCYYKNDHGGESVLIATPEGMACPNCDHMQLWVHAFMANWPTGEEIEVQIQADESVLISVEQASRVLGVSVEAIFHLLESGRVEYAPDEMQNMQAPAGHRRLKLENVLVYKFKLDDAERTRAERSAMSDDDLESEREVVPPPADVVERIAKAFPNSPGVVKITEAAIQGMEMVKGYMAAAGLSIADMLATVLNCAGDLGVRVDTDADGDHFVEFEVGESTQRLTIKPDESTYVVRRAAE